VNKQLLLAHIQAAGIISLSALSSTVGRIRRGKKLSLLNYLNDIRDLDNLNKSSQPSLMCTLAGLWLLAPHAGGLKVHRRLNSSVWENSSSSAIEKQEYKFRGNNSQLLVGNFDPIAANVAANLLNVHVLLERP